MRRVRTNPTSVCTSLYDFNPQTSTLTVLHSSCHESLLTGMGDTACRVIPVSEREMYLQQPASVEAPDAGERLTTILLERLE